LGIVLFLDKYLPATVSLLTMEQNEEISPRLLELFFEVQRGLPRQGPGDDASTLRALAMCSSLPDAPAVLDVGCGPGMQTLALASALKGKIVAIDNCGEYLDELTRRAAAAGFAGQIETRNADMSKLPFPDASFDLVWCEGAAYNMGVTNALKAWRPLLRESGFLVFSELVWLTNAPPTEAEEFFGNEYPAMATVDTVRGYVIDADYDLIGHFTLPDASWWTHYYTPLQSKLPDLLQKYADDREALAVISMTETEIAIRERFSGNYGYEVFVARRSP
jgi:ubiquinone/menaquinone biosynthesis C-methylase UbiE